MQDSVLVFYNASTLRYHDTIVIPDELGIREIGIYGLAGFKYADHLVMPSALRDIGQSGLAASSIRST